MLHLEHAPRIHKEQVLGRLALNAVGGEGMLHLVRNILGRLLAAWFSMLRVVFYVTRTQIWYFTAARRTNTHGFTLAVTYPYHACTNKRSNA